MDFLNAAVNPCLGSIIGCFQAGNVAQIDPFIMFGSIETFGTELQTDFNCTKGNLTKSMDEIRECVDEAISNVDKRETGQLKCNELSTIPHTCIIGRNIDCFSQRLST